VPEEAEGEADVPAQQPEASEATRLPAAHAHSGRPGDRPGSAPEGPRPAVGLIGRISDRATFDALRHSGRRARQGPVTVVFVPGDDDGRVVSDAGHARREVRVAYGVGRHVGSAVVRNRVRRRLRAAIREVDRERGGLHPGAYLVTARPEAAGMTYLHLKRSLADACEAVAEGVR
jgi:ribonuclease P protein component